jgi:hypothetical protein
MRSLLATSTFKKLQAFPMAEVWQNIQTGDHSLHAAQSFSPNQVIGSFAAATTLSYPSYLTIQIALHSHITLNPFYLQYVNHSCTPNIFFDTARSEYIALTALQPGDELVFFYPSTEWDIQQPFACHCGARNCLKVIKGAAHLSPAQLKKYRLSNFVLEQLKLHVSKKS